jgi:hypothetical protein
LGFFFRLSSESARNVHLERGKTKQGGDVCGFPTVSLLGVSGECRFGVHICCPRVSEVVRGRACQDKARIGDVSGYPTVSLLGDSGECRFGVQIFCRRVFEVVVRVSNLESADL